MRKNAMVLGVFGALAFATSALAMPIGIFSEIAGDPTSQVPGLDPGVAFDSFDRPYRSPDGSLWIMTASSDLTSSEDEVLIVGSGPTSAGAMTVVREGTQAPWGGAGETVGFLNRRVGITDTGWYTFGTNLGGDAPTDKDEQIVRWNAVTEMFEVAASEGADVPGFPDEVFGSTLDSASIVSDGTVGFRADFTSGGLPSDQDEFVFLGDTAIAQAGVTVPGGTTEVWDGFDTEDQYFDATGGSYLLRGDLAGDSAMDDVVVVNGNIVVQEGVALPGFTSPVDGGGPTEAFMMSNGDWFVRGDNEDGQDWVVRNGDIIAKTGDEVPGSGGTEFYSDAIFSSTFFSMTGNNNGDFVFGATTDNPDESADAVLVYNNEQVLLRQGDPVDLDGDGEFNDDTFIDIFNNDDQFLTDDGWLYFTATLVDGAGTDLGQAYLAYFIPEPTSLGLLLIGALALRRRR